VTRRSLRSLLLRLAHALDQDKPLPMPKRKAFARELRDAAAKGIKA
jgi:hypothetical protein